MTGFQYTSRVLWFGYVVLFSVAAIVCFVSVRRVDRIEDPDSRRGLRAMLVISGLWAAAHVGYIAAPTPTLQYWFYVGGLVVGPATVGAWLYFCSAYTGRSLHRNTRIRQVAVGVYLVVVSIKVTNPIHGLYFTASPSASPFPHLLVQHEPLYWITMGLAYALAFIGFFMLYELFLEVSYDTAALFGVVLLSGLPILIDVGSVTTNRFVEFTYQPLGVAAFAIGVFYVYIDRFQTINLTGETDEPMILLDETDRIRDYNRAARTLYPELRGTNGVPLESVLPSIFETLDATDAILEIERDGTTSYYRLTTNPFSASGEQLGRMLTLTDITRREQYRQRLEQQNDRLDQFASIISHDLRNPMMVAKARIEFAVEEGDISHLQSADEALDRMDELIEDVLLLAREGQQIDEPVPVDVASVAEKSWEMVETTGATLQLDEPLDRTVDADPARLQQLFENLFRNCVEHGSTSPASSARQNTVEHSLTSRSEPVGSEDGVEHGSTSSRSLTEDQLERGGRDISVTVGPLPAGTGFYVEDTGTGIPAAIRDEIFDPGFTTNEVGTGFGLAIVTEIVQAHGWDIRTMEGATGGARFEIQTASN
ncbi:histidine kinase [Halovivax asiaticus JCM 14624]|uniref:histidine kinase n=1 Tax=Halovivax asiaticus JCM 14624 TaxID=1227490 RepID=M0BDD8_9EURY|nr:histidine kinase N-terminal 7TM domain-containing protein [Halovivax asiaticus]ELZ08318.1 histidine kinase [Halovivax asiaticus JCM 14624]